MKAAAYYVPFVVGWVPIQLWALWGVYESCWKIAPNRMNESRYETAYDYAVNRVTWGRVFAVPIAVGLLVAMAWYAIYGVMLSL